MNQSATGLPSFTLGARFTRLASQGKRCGLVAFLNQPINQIKPMAKTEFKCSVCKQVKPVTGGCTTGYGIDRHNRKVCFACCGERDKADMIKTGKATLYLSKHENGKQHGNFALGCQPASPVWTVGNWPGTLKLSAFVRVGGHNIAGRRYDAWFTGPDDRQWHGVTYGDNTQICHCKRLNA